MTGKYTRLIILTACCLLAGSTIYYSLKSRELSRELVQSNEARARQASQLEAFSTSLYIDSLLANGSYEAAIDALNRVNGGLDGPDPAGINLRISAVSQLIQERNHYRQNSVGIEAPLEADSLEADTADAKGIRQIDSLNFALDKMRIELAGLKKELKSNNSGKYLKFRSKKGTLMHYVGEVVDGKANGYGIALLETGSRYEGLWKENQRHGQGAFYWPDGQYYIGHYEEDLRDGNGTYYWPNGEKYVGDWKNDQRSGEGIFYGGDAQVVAQGMWKDDKLVEER